MTYVNDSERQELEELKVPLYQVNEISRCKPWNGYINQVMAEHLKEHKYSGCDEGYSYIYFWNPVANWLV